MLQKLAIEMSCLSNTVALKEHMNHAKKKSKKQAKVLTKNNGEFIGQIWIDYAMPQKWKST